MTVCPIIAKAFLVIFHTLNATNIMGQRDRNTYKLYDVYPIIIVEYFIVQMQQLL